MQQILYLLLGIIAGMFSGMFGVGGATIMIPAMVYLFGLTQHQAQGTTLAIMVFPIGLLAALRYWRSGNVKMDMVAVICIGFFIGGLLGANFVQNLADPLLKKLFGFFLLCVSLYMIFVK